MDLQKRIIDSVSEIGKSRIGLGAYENQLETAGTAWLEDISRRVSDGSDESAVQEAGVELASIVELLRALTGTPGVNELMGKTLSMLIRMERLDGSSRKIMRRLLSPVTANRAADERKRLLIVNPVMASTKAAYFEGIEKICETELYLSPDDTGDINSRVEWVVSWMMHQGIDIQSLDGIAFRCGFMKPVPSGTYQIAPEMIKDLEESHVEHASNMAAAMVMEIAALNSNPDNLLITTTDPVVSDEMETVERMTGLQKIRRDGAGTHYLNHNAVRQLIADCLERSSREVSAVTVYLGKSFSLALHRDGKVPATIDAFAGMPSTNRSGPLDLPKVLEGVKSDEITFKELEAAISNRGGLLSLAGTNDFRALEGFRQKGATSVQQKKIDFIFNFFARRITSGILSLTTDGKPIDFVALTGALTDMNEISQRVIDGIAGRYPVVVLPGSIEHESLAAGLLRSFYEPDTIRNYPRERDALHARRIEENRILDAVLFDRKVIYRKKGAPIVTLDELIDDARITVKEHSTPTIAIVGADNEEAILAAKRANEEGNYRIARFKLVGDFAAINQIAYDFDLIIDNDNYSIIDTENPVEEAVKLLDENQTHILMKGFVKTEEILRGVFQYLRRTGRIKPGELISHIFVMDIPVRNKLLLISDAAVNTYPDEEKRVKIIENALRVAANLNIHKPKVAVVSAIESVNKSIESSIEAERIAQRFAGRDDCIVEGPLSFDVAMDPAIANEKHYKGQIRGNADILIMPDIDAGNVLYKSLTTQSGASCAGVIIAGNLPLVLTSRGDSARSKLASISLAVKMYFDMAKR